MWGFAAMELGSRRFDQTTYKGVPAAAPPAAAPPVPVVPASEQAWLQTRAQRRAAARWTVAGFATGMLAIIATGIVALATARTADVAFDDLEARIDDPDVQCLRVARRADYTVAFVGVGSPVQHLQLLLSLGEAVDDGDSEAPAMSLFSERLHKSKTMRCVPFSPARTYSEDCHDIALVYSDATTQGFVQTRFEYKNREIADAFQDDAYLAGLDGTLRLVRGAVYWVTTTHVCFSTEGADATGAVERGALPYAYDAATGAAQVQAADLHAFPPLADAPAAKAFTNCGPALVSTADLFPPRAAAERVFWLVLTTTFVYEYANDVLAARREVVEVGEACAATRADLERVNDMYRLDCVSHSPSRCRVDPSVPFRRVAQSRLRIDVDADGAAALRAEQTRALSAIPYLVSYSHGLLLAFGRLLIMLLTAAVVFVRGNQDATSNKYMLVHALETIHARARGKQLLSWPAPSWWTAGADLAITVLALAARGLVLGFSARTMLDDGLTSVVVFEALGGAASLVHIGLRVGALERNFKKRAVEAPLTKLAGPMSLVDVSAAVLLLFADPPLLSTHDGRFAAVGRLLIAILISISVFSRCVFAIAICALMASSVYNVNGNRTELAWYRPVLLAAGLLWLVQLVAASASLSVLFVNPAAFAMTRTQAGDVEAWRYCLFFGLVTAGLPTFTKVSLRVLEHECARSHGGEACD